MAGGYRYGVTAFCPTTAACEPLALRTALAQVRERRQATDGRGARVLPAHLESNFINPAYRPGAHCLGPRARVQPARGGRKSPGPSRGAARDAPGRSLSTGADILREIDGAAPDVGIVTVAPELDGGLDLIRWLAARGHHVSLGHSNATYDEALAAIAAGARQATHLFNRMPPLDHRAPGLVGAILQTDEVAAEIICDGFHIHPAVIRMAIAAKRPSRILAITDGTAASGLPPGARTASARTLDSRW